MLTPRRTVAICLASVLLAVGLAACGGGGSSGASNITAPSAASSVFPASATLANICTTSGEQRFIRSYMDEVYLWYREIPAIDPTRYATLSSYFYALLVTTPDANGLPKDQFSFVVNTADADAFSTGVNVGYGVEWKLDASGRQRVALISENSPAADAGMARGGQLVQILERNVASWYPNQAGAYARFLYRDTPTSDPREIKLLARTVTENPVPLSTTVTTPSGNKAGYLLFNDHSEGAQDKLIAAVRGLQSQGLQELVLDMRYNSGGYLYVAQSLASMVSSASATGRIFESLRYNDKRNAATTAGTYTFTNAALYGESTYPSGTVLPKLNLRRVYMLTSSGTCSASESVINGLRGVDVEVILVGGATCGKPFGFTRKDNCNRAYYPIEFQGTNAKGFGDYSAGFAPTCNANDDLDRRLGQADEGQLASALHHMDTGQCAATPTQGFMPQSVKTNDEALANDAKRPAHGRLLHPLVQ